MDTKPSFQVFDYRIRPNKSAERRMFSEAFLRLSFFEPIENYRYIGFGSTTFADFILFHRVLNMKDMISIEKREEYKARFEFNRPFHCVHVEYGDSNEVLPKLSWDKRTIVWLDYDGTLNGSVLRDVAFVSSKALSGSTLVVTVNATGYRQRNRNANYHKVERGFLSRFKKQIERKELPPDVKGTHLQGNGMAKTCRRIIVDEIEEALRNRNGLSLSEHKMKFQPLFNLVYRDGAKMLTVGGIFYRANDKETLEKCQFNNLDYVTSNKNPYEIKIPVMTPRERHYLNRRLPHGASEEGANIGLTEDEVHNYVRLYRYCPSFAEIELT